MQNVTKMELCLNSDVSGVCLVVSIMLHSNRQDNATNR